MDLSAVLPELRARFKPDQFRDRLRKSDLYGDERHTFCPVSSAKVITYLGVQCFSPPDPFWAETFQQLFVHSHQEGRDDLLFFVKWDPFLEAEMLEVVRKDPKSLPSSSDESILWDQTLYLNIILHEFEYEVTGSAVTVKTDSDIINSVQAKIVLPVFPSPSHRRMDKKDQISDVIYPNIMFCVDNFEEIFSDMHVCAPGEKVAVQLTASNKAAAVKQMVFLGAVDYTTLKEAFDKRDHVSLSTRLKRMSVKRSSRIYDFNYTYQFLQMRGPDMKGFAEMAVSKAKHEAAADRPMTPIQLLSKNQKYSPLLKHASSGASSTGAAYNPLSVSVSSSKSENSNPVASNGKDKADDDSGISDTEQIAISVKSNSLLRNGSHDSSTRGRGDSSTAHLEGSLPGSVSDEQEVKGRGSPGLVRASGGASAWREGSEEGSGGGSHGATAASATTTSRDLPNGEVSQKKGLLKGRLKLPRLSSRKKLPAENPTLHAYLTYVQLPWYALIDDILNSTKKAVL